MLTALWRSSEIFLEVSVFTFVRGTNRRPRAIHSFSLGGGADENSCQLNGCIVWASLPIHIAPMPGLSHLTFKDAGLVVRTGNYTSQIQPLTLQARRWEKVKLKAVPHYWEWKWGRGGCNLFCRIIRSSRLFNNCELQFEANSHRGDQFWNEIWNGRH